MTKFFRKSKKPYFSQKLIFLEKRALSVFNFPIIYHCVKNQKKLITHSYEICQTDIQTDRQTVILQDRP